MSIPPRKNPKNTKTLRQELRASATPAEKLLWQYIKEKQIDNYRFRRQHGVGPYILDFYCPSLRLGIELDGNVHDDVIVQEHDLEREKYLKEIARIHVLRFENEEVTSNTEAVVEVIRCWIAKNNPSF